MDRQQQPPQPPGRRRVTMLVVEVGEQQGAIDDDPVLEVELMLLDGSAAGESLATSLRVPEDRLPSFRTGAHVTAEVSASDPRVLDVAWDSLGRRVR